MKSDVKRYVRLVDFTYASFIKETIVDKTLNDFCNFLRQYTIPGNGEFWSIGQNPLLILNLQVNAVKKKEYGNFF